jgi:hypothetical protein
MVKVGYMVNLKLFKKKLA